MWSESPLLFGCISEPEPDISHLGDIIFHQIFVEGVGDLQPTDEGRSGYILVTIGPLIMEVVT